MPTKPQAVWAAGGGRLFCVWKSRLEIGVEQSRLTLNDRKRIRGGEGPQAIVCSTHAARYLDRPATVKADLDQAQLHVLR
jgi:hypothetical protein